MRPPSPISDENFSNICRDFDIPASLKAELRKELDLIIDDIASEIAGKRKGRNRKEDRLQMKFMAKRIKEVRLNIDKTGPAGRLALKATSGYVGPMVSAGWLRDQFPDDSFVPSRSSVPCESGTSMRRSIRSPIRGLELDIEEESLNARLQFVNIRSKRTLSAILKALELGLCAALGRIEEQPGARGGRVPLLERRRLLINLARLWHNTLGRIVQGGLKSEFSKFSEDVVAACSWPPEGVADDVPKAIKEWRNRTQKNSRLRK